MEDDTPLMPLRAVHDLRAWAKADPSNTRNYVCGLVAATTDAVLSATRNGRMGGWMFAQEAFVRAVRAIRDLNARGTVYTYGTDLAQRLPTNWGKLADAVESYARDVPRQMRWTGERPPDSIPRDIISPECDRPVDSQVLQTFFDYCLSKAKAALTSPTDRETVEDWYRCGVFDAREKNRRTLSLHTKMLHANAEADARIESRLDAIKAMLAAIGENVERGADAAVRSCSVAEANGAAIAANGAKLEVIVGRAGDKEVSAAQMAEIISDELSKTGNSKGLTMRTIQNWEAFINHGGTMGTQPPQGYTLYTRRTWAEANAFAIAYAQSEASRLKKRIAFDDLKHYKP